MPASESANVSAGTNATATAVNNIRKDAITRYVRYQFHIKGSLRIGDEQGQKYIVPADQTIVGTTHMITSGTSATFRIQADTGDIDSGISATPTLTTDSTPTDSTVTAGQVLSLDITGVSGSPVELIVQVIAKELLT